MKINVLCEKVLSVETSGISILVNNTIRWKHTANYVKCPLGHYTHRFLACDYKTSCWYDGDTSSNCENSMATPLTYFSCNNHVGRVPYTLVCDHRIDCSDESDEDFCTFSPCDGGYFTCDNTQCIPFTKTCNGWADCATGEDEDQCRRTINVNKVPSGRPPFLVNVTHGVLKAGSLYDTCPGSHFRCLNNGHCLPFFLRCNDVRDCPGHEDEEGCDLCPGFYRCRASKVCLRDSDLCDGHAVCPQHDDELLCDSDCPPVCVCEGLAFFCGQNFTASAYPLLRFLDASGSTMTPAHLTNNTLLIHLILANCGLTDLHESLFPNLLSLDVRGNNISSFSHLLLHNTPKLRELSVASNPLAIAFEGGEEFSFPQILELDLSHTSQHVLNVTALTAFPSLHSLNLSHSGVWRIEGEGFGIIEQLNVIDLRGCPMTWIPHGLFHGLTHLRAVHASNFKLCCSAVLPLEFNLRHCFAPINELSSCGHLLRETEYSVCVFVASLLALAGNVVSFTFRTYTSKRKTKLGYGNFVTHLSVSDFLMGVYLAVIGVADQVYRGTYLWNDLTWRHSVVCKLAGFLSLLSCEVSALIMCLITLDRFLVIRFPFSMLHFSPRSSQTASFVVWVIGVLFSSIPLLPMTSHWEFYSQTGICTPLPITKEDFAGHDYSFSIMIVFNFVLFLFITLGQFNIYWAVRANSMSVSNSTKKSKDLSIARRLITVAITDFLCWFPIGVLGLMASNGIPISGNINVAVAIFVLPLNSAVNPCLYTFNAIQERRSRAREEKLRGLLIAQLKLTNNTDGFPPS